MGPILNWTYDPLTKGHDPLAKDHPERTPGRPVLVEQSDPLHLRPDALEPLSSDTLVEVLVHLVHGFVPPLEESRYALVVRVAIANTDNWTYNGWDELR
jgi:hypothetical protein